MLGQVATGFCFGGGVANTLAVRLGRISPLRLVLRSADGRRRAEVKAAILVHHGARRPPGRHSPNAKALQAAGVPHEGHIYPGAVHGFNNDATPERYNKAAADQAWNSTIAWFNKYARTSAS